MPKFRIPFDITGEVVIAADNEAHAKQLFDAMPLAEVAKQGEFTADDPEYIEPDHAGEAADAGYDALDGARSL